MKLNGHDLNLLDEYNQFLLNHGYCDTDIELEEPTAINGFIDELNNEPKQPYQEPDFLCTWDFCTTCIKYRKDHNLPMPELKPHPSKVK